MTANHPLQEEQNAKRPSRQVLPWSALLRRVFALDVLVCAVCGGEMRVMAYISEQNVVEKILTHLGLPTEPPPLAPARMPLQLHFYDPDADTVDPRRRNDPQVQPGRGHPGRGPPDDEPGDWVVEFDEPKDTGDWGA